MTGPEPVPRDQLTALRETRAAVIGAAACGAARPVPGAVSHPPSSAGEGVAALAQPGAGVAQPVLTQPALPAGTHLDLVVPGFSSAIPVLSAKILASSTAGTGSGTVASQALEVTMDTTSALAPLYRDASEGTVFPTVTVQAIESSGVVYETLTLTSSIVASVSSTSAQTGSSSVPETTVVFRATKLCETIAQRSVCE